MPAVTISTPKDRRRAERVAIRLYQRMTRDMGYQPFGCDYPTLRMLFPLLAPLYMATLRALATFDASERT